MAHRFQTNVSGRTATTLLQMLKDRTYVVPSGVTQESIQQAITKAFAKKASSVKATIRSDEAWVFFHLCPGVAQIRIIIATCIQEKVSRVIVVVRDTPTSAAKKLMLNPVAVISEEDDATLQAVPICFECFRADDLLLNPTRHLWQPKVFVTTETQQIDVILKGLRSTYDQLPAILETDALARYFGARRRAIFVFEDLTYGKSYRAVRKEKP